MRAKHLTLLVAIFAIITMMFVSCNSEVAENSAISEPGKELVYASFVDKGAKELSFSYDVPAYDTLFWRYSAVKKDSYGTVGQTWAGEPAEEVFAPIPTNATTPTQGLDGKVGPFSQGKWDFKLQAFRRCTLDNNNTLVFSDKVFEGTATNVVLNKNQTNYIAVTVTPAADTGKIKISDAYYEWASSANAGTAQVKLVVTLVGRPDGSNSTDPVTYTYNELLTKETSENKYKFKGNGGYIAIPDTETTVTTAIPAGVYTATFKIVENTETPTIDEFVLQTFSLKVYGGLETIVSGNLTEGLSYENYFSVPEQTIAFTTSTNNGSASFDVPKTPSTATGETIKTTVVFPENTLSSNTQHTLTVDVTTIETAETQFVIIPEEEQNPEVAVAAIGLELTKTTVTTDESGEVTDTTTSTVSEFTDYVTITTFIQEGLTGKITVVYNDPNAGTETAKTQPIAKEGATAETEGKSVATRYATDAEMGDKLGYSAESGKLRFKTDHFSDFYVKTDGLVAQNVNSGKYYSTLQSAMDAAISGQTVKVLANIDLGTTGLVITGTNVTLDLNGKTISGAVNGKLVTITESASVTITDSSVLSTGHIYNTDKSAQGHDAIYNLGSLVIEAGSFGHEEYTRGPGLRNLGTAIINGGVFYGCGNGGYAYSVINGNENDCPSLTLNAGTISGQTHGGIAVNSGNVTIEKDFTVDIEGNFYVIWVTNDGTATNVVINGGTFSGGKYGLYTALDDGETKGYSDVSIKVYDGTFSGTLGSIKRGSTGTTYSFDVELYGGSYSSDPSNYVAPGYVAEENAGLWTVKSVFDGKGTKDDPYLIKNTTDWMTLVSVCATDNNYSATEGNYYSVTDNLDFSSINSNVGVKFFNGSIDFNGHSVQGFNQNNTTTEALIYEIGTKATISNLDFYVYSNGDRIFRLTHDICYSKPYNPTNIDVEFRNVDLFGNVGIASNNTGMYLNWAYSCSGIIKFINCNNYCNIISSGYAAAYVGLVYGGSTQLELVFNNCKNYGTIISTGKDACVLVSNPTKYSTDHLTMTISGCENYGKIYCAKDHNAALAFNYTDGYAFFTKEEIAEFESSGKIVNKENGSYSELTTTTIALSGNKFDFATTVSSLENAVRFELSYQFQGTRGNANGGVTSYTIAFNSVDDLTSSEFYNYEWKNAKEHSTQLIPVENIDEHEFNGTKYYTYTEGNQTYYVYNRDGYWMGSSKPIVNLNAFDADGNIVLVAYYQYQ